MKRLFSLALLLIASINSGQAQNIAYEVIRTPEAPGYFALRVYPGSDLPELEVETVFVENFTSSFEKRTYRSVTQAIQNIGVQVLRSNQAVDLVKDDNYRLVLLGGPVQSRWLQFRVNNKSVILDEFETFSFTQLGPVYLRNIKADFGGNAQQVRPDKVPFLNDQATYFVGQFDKPIKTRVSLSGETPEIVVQADGVMDLSTYRPHPADGVLKQLWKDLDPPLVKEGLGGISSWDLKKAVINSFPFLLAVIGLFIMWLATRPSKFRTGMIETLNDEFWHTPIEETPLYQAWEKTFPWELSDKELKLAQA